MPQYLILLKNTVAPTHHFVALVTADDEANALEVINPGTTPEGTTYCVIDWAAHQEFTTTVNPSVSVVPV